MRTRLTPDERISKLVNERQRLIKRIEKLEREHKNAQELRGRLIRITAEEIRVVVRMQKKAAA